MRLRTIPLQSAQVTCGFWSEWQRQMGGVGIPHQWALCEETGRLENLRRCGRGESDGHQGLRFNDSDVYKLLEASCYASALGLGEGLEDRISDTVDVIASAQLEDGYINSYVQLAHPEMKWRSVNALHEMYCMGHLIEAAVACLEVSGSRRLLDVAVRCANHVMARFPSSGPPMYAGHQEIELGLARLAAVTGEARYADYARWQLLSRGSRPSPYEAELADPAVVAVTPGVRPLFIKDGEYDGGYAQDDVPLVKQTRAVGHAVRAMYYYSAATELLADDARVMASMGAIWENLTSKQMYVTGGIGSSGRNEGFTDDYDLPNLDAYAETCAAIGLVFWAWRLFCATGRAAFVDVLELALYNAVLSGVSLSCDRYFYENPLESDGRHERAPWFPCACCPPNIARLIMSIGRYAAAAGEWSVWIAIPIAGQYSAGAADVEIDAGYPWSGDYCVRIGRAEGLRCVALRVPEWAGEFEASVNDARVFVEPVDGFVVIERDWSAGDEVTVRCSAKAEWVIAHSSVLSCAGRVALQRGPLVYCLEQYDLGAAPHRWSADAKRAPSELGRTLRAEGRLDGPTTSRLYSASNHGEASDRTATFVPYYTWANRRAGAMQVWVRRA